MRSIAAVLLLALVPGVHAGPGDGGGKQRTGTRDPACGNELVLVRPDGSRERYPAIADFVAKFPGRRIDQGEKPRDGVAVEALLKAYDAAWVEALDCDNRSVHLPGGMPVTVPEYLVLTGRGTLKAVREIQPGRYVNTVQQIRKLTFHGAKAAGRADAK